MKFPLLRLVLVSGLSGAGKASALRTLEDIGFETMDNPPLDMLETLVREQSQGPETPGNQGIGLAIGIDVRSRGFDEDMVLGTIARLKALAGVELEFFYMTADDNALLGRYTETRRRHPLASRGGRLAEAIALERALTDRLRSGADLVIDTTDLKLSDLRQLLETKFNDKAAKTLTVSITSFAFPKGLPHDADMVFDARFLRNPYYDPILRPRTGLDADVAQFVADDPDFAPFMQKMTDFLQFLLPRFVREGKKYATIAIGCTGGRHRSVHVAESLARSLSFGTAHGIGIGVSVMHRELGHTLGRKNPLVFFGQDKVGHLDHSDESDDAADSIRHRSPEIKQ